MRVGIAHHLGWAVAVTSSAAYEVVDRRRIELIEPGVAAAPIHHEGKPLDDAATATGMSISTTPVTSSHANSSWGSGPRGPSARPRATLRPPWGKTSGWHSRNDHRRLIGRTNRECREKRSGRRHRPPAPSSKITVDQSSLPPPWWPESSLPHCGPSCRRWRRWRHCRRWTKQRRPCMRGQWRARPRRTVR